MYRHDRSYDYGLRGAPDAGPERRSHRDRRSGQEPAGRRADEAGRTREPGSDRDAGREPFDYEFGGRGAR
jgi:hypothetical protein